MIPEGRTYAGGLGVLVGDKMRAAEALGMDVDVLTFSYPLGYARQRIVDGEVVSEPTPWKPKALFRKVDEFDVNTKFGTIGVEILQRGHAFLVHTGLAERLYVEDSPEERLKKEVLLGKVAAELFERGEYDIMHMEESQTVFAGLELIARKGSSVKKHLAFTTHTPLAHGHERWDSSLLTRIYGSPLGQGTVNLTKIAIRISGVYNAVSKLHAHVMERQGFKMPYVTNGVHFETWAAQEIQDEVGTPERMAYFDGDLEEIKAKNKERLVETVNKEAILNKEFSEDALTIAVARRITGYKRNALVLKNVGALERIAKDVPTQIVLAGQAHPADNTGIEQIKRILNAIEYARHVRIAYIPWYDMGLAQTLLQGADVWLFYPREEDEACGTSWMKAMMNGAHVIATEAGGVPEFCIHGVNAWLLSPGDDDAQAVRMYAIIRRLAGMFGKKEFYDVPTNAIRSSIHLLARRMMVDYKRLYRTLQ